MSIVWFALNVALMMLILSVVASCAYRVFFGSWPWSLLDSDRDEEDDL